MFSDNRVSVCCVISPDSRMGEISASDGVPLNIAVAICCGALNYEAARRDALPLDEAPDQWTIYSYGPIGKNDLEIRLDAMRDTAASIDYIIKLMTFSANSHEKKHFANMDYVYDFLDKENIRTKEFHKALSLAKRTVERRALEVARNRHRRKKMQSTASESAPRPTRTKKKKKTSHGHKKRPCRSGCGSKSRRENNTP